MIDQFLGGVYNLIGKAGYFSVQVLSNFSDKVQMIANKHKVA